MANKGTITANGTVEVTHRGSVEKPGKFQTLYASGTWSGGTLQVKASPDDTSANAQDVTDIKLTDDGLISFQVRCVSLWLVLSGASSPNINWWVV